MAVCFSCVVAPVSAQTVTGAVAGRAEAGTQVTVTNTATGLSRTATVNADGSYRLAQLPVGNYRLQVTRGGQPVGSPIAVNVELAGTTTVNLGSEGNVANLDAVTVVGSTVVNRVDVRSTESATNITREEVARMPVDQTLTSVALLAPGVVATGATFGGLTFGGSSVAENATYINGLNVTDPYRRQGFSSVPFGFFDQFQIKTGGYSAEFGRTTGGVINAVTRSGGNEFHGGVELTFEPSVWRAQKDDHFHSDGTVDERDRTSRDDGSFFKTNLWASGPIVKDKLFFFAMYEMRDADSRDIDTTQAFYTDSPNDFWGTKFDWQITDNHLLELLAFSDKNDSTTTKYAYNWDAAALGANLGDSSTASGGDNWSLTYTGHFTDNFVAKALYGVNKRSAFSGSPRDADCSAVARAGSYTAAFGPATTQEGCHPTGNRATSQFNKREVARLDFEWTLGDHLLRFGLDQEIQDSNNSERYPGDGLRYEAQAATPGGALPNGALVPAGVTRIIDARRFFTGSPLTTEMRAFYVEDNWNVTPNLLLNLGVRADMFHNKLPSGSTFAKADFSDMISPRVGFSWDMKGDGTTKLFGNAGRYYLPLTNRLADYFGGGTTDEHTYYVLNGWTPRIDPTTGATYLFPDLGPQIGPVNTEGNVIARDDLRTQVARDLEMVFQDEYILGFQQAINQAWSYGVNATYRKVNRAVEDTRINHIPGCPGYSDFPIINPGETTTLWCEDTGQYVTVDTSVDGYQASGSGAIFGYKKPRRTYKAVEFQLDRAWDDKWAFNASYLWSKSEGNIEGPVNSDLGYNDTNLVQFYDHPAVNERYGVLFNDHRHQIKLRGSYKLNEMWSFGATVSTTSGGPITAFGVRWPNDNRAAGGTSEFSGGGSGWLCVANCSSLNRQLIPTERGAFGRMPWVTNVGANVTWTLPVEGIDLKARLSVYNLFNSQTVLNVHSRYETTPGNRQPYFGQGTVWQSPRYANLVVTWNF
jgi:outer membrane receptor for ferrienterochelin and colicin